MRLPCHCFVGLAGSCCASRSEPLGQVRCPERLLLDQDASREDHSRPGNRPAISPTGQSNNELKERAKNADVGDPAARAARVQSLLRRSAGCDEDDAAEPGCRATASNGRAEDTAKQNADRELKDLLTQYRVALDKAVAPVEARILNRSRRRRKVQGFLGVRRLRCRPGRLGLAEQRWNTEREKACAPWWQASGRSMPGSSAIVLIWSGSHTLGQQNEQAGAGFMG